LKFKKKRQSLFNWLQRLRWLAIFGQVAILSVASEWMLLPLDLWPLVGIFGIASISNLALSYLPSHMKAKDKTFATILLCDILLLTLVLYFSGGPANPFSIIYLLHVVLCAVIMSEIWTWATTILTIGLFGVLFFFHLPPNTLHTHNHTTEHLNSHLLGMWFAYIIVSLITAYCVTRISRELKLAIKESTILKSNQQKLASLTALSAGAAHELSTPLGTIALVVGELGRKLRLDLLDPQVEKDLELMKSQIDRCKNIISSMGIHSGEIPGETPISIDLLDFIKENKNSLKNSFGHIVDVQLVGESAPIVISQNAIMRVLFILTKNAVEASYKEKQPVLVLIELVGTSLKLLVIDKGEGISEENLLKIGEPFFTTKTPHEGMGLGVFLAKLTIETLGGSFNLTSKINSGTSVEIEIPITRIEDTKK
jgi:two-component system, sensor histidine kinase RegB